MDLRQAERGRVPDRTTPATGKPMLPTQCTIPRDKDAVQPAVARPKGLFCSSLHRLRKTTGEH